MFLPLKFALRYIFSKKSHSAVNMISIVAVCGIVISTAAIVCVLSVFNGFSDLIESKLASLDPDIKVCAAQGKTINNADSIIGIVTSIPEIETALPTIQDNALAIYQERQKTVILKGVTPGYEKLNNIEGIVKDDGRYLLSDEYGKYALVSIGCAIELQAHPGYYTDFKLYAPQRRGKINISNPTGALRADTLFISGVFQVDQYEYDQNTVIVPIDIARHLFDYTTEATAIEISVKEDVDIDNIIADIQAKLGKNYLVKDRLMQQEASFKMVNIEKWISFLLLAFILIIASFNVISSISVLIVEKETDISTLRTLGAGLGLITSIFTLQTWVITMTGTVIGIITGISLCLVQQHFGLIKLGGTTAEMIIDSYPVLVKWDDILIVLLLTLLIASLASLATSTIMRSRLRNYK